MLILFEVNFTSRSKGLNCSSFFFILTQTVFLHEAGLMHVLPLTSVWMALKDQRRLQGKKVEKTQYK